MKVYENILGLVGNTPLVRINRLNNGYANIYAKVEFFNPASSIKDRVALNMIEDAEKKGLINKDTTIIEPTSGNTGIGLALVCAIKGYKLILTMPESMSKERRDILSIYGAKLVLTKASEGMKGSINEALKIKENTPNSIILSQFDNPSNIEAHIKTTSLEIYNDLDGKVDVVVAGIGTGGTISGIGKALKSKNTNIEIIGLEPSSSPVITKGIAAPHKIQGIGANFVPKNYLSEYVDRVDTVSDDESIDIARKLAYLEGIFVGISSGASMAYALKLSKDTKYKDKNIVVILPDTGMRYLSSPMFQ